jgi:hypothetical protein
MRAWVLIALFGSLAHADPLAKYGARMKQLLEPQARGARIDVRSEAGQLGTTVVVAAIPGAYPGSGVVRVVVDRDEQSYGVHGDKDLADLARLREWLVKPPTVGELVRIVNDAQFEGIAILEADKKDPLKITPAGLELRVMRYWIPSSQPFPTLIRIPKTGRVSIEKR